MSLKLTLKPHERIIIGGAVISNGNKTAEIAIENSVPILRQKDIMTEDQATSPARRIYFAVQLMYIDSENRELYINSYFGFSQEMAEAAPSTSSYLTKISELIAVSQFYQALKTARQLIEYEKELIANA